MDNKKGTYSGSEYHGQITIYTKFFTLPNLVLYDIFSITKKTCSSLGIHCPDSLSLYDSITGDPYAEKSKLLEMDFEIDEDNSLSHDIIITFLPYTVTAPTFTWEGPSTYEMSVNNPKPKIWYNKSYFQKPPVK